jgi:Zn-dependent alcohol dehydrogenase
MFLDGRFSVEGFVTHRYPLGQINEAIAAMRAGVSLHSMIHFGSP